MTVSVSARLATNEDVDRLVELYGHLEEEMHALHVMWRKADALSPPLAGSFADAIASDSSSVVVGELDGLVFGFMIGFNEQLVDGSRIGAIRFIFTEMEAREVGVGAAMRDVILDELRAMGLTRFDAHVLPGHRLVKNFFESSGFAARTIVMYRNDGA